MTKTSIGGALFCAAVFAAAAAAVAFGMPHDVAAPSGLALAMAVQTAYSETQGKAIAGMIANMTNKNVDTRVCETAAGIGFGVAVSQGSADNGVLLGGASAAVFAGISVRDITLVNDSGDEYQEGDNVAVLTRGDIWVQVGGDVVKGNDVTFNSTTGVLSSAAGSGSQFAISGARWMTSASSGGLAICRLSGNLPSA